jgi:N-acyl-D-amino-acid deacylase
VEGAEVIDAAGLTVAPGFVDMHIHEDPYNAEEDSFGLCISHTMLKMGVTTAVGGNCGLTKGHPNPLVYLDAVDRRGFPINLALLVPHDTLRSRAGTPDLYQKAEASNVEIMTRQLKEFLDGGCIGLSVGLEYIPGADTEEIRMLLKAVGEYERVTSAHIRYDAGRSIIALEEIIGAAKSVDAPLQISHIGGMCAFGQIESAISMIDRHKAEGADLMFDCYPYYAYCTTIGSAVFDGEFLSDFGHSDKSYSDLEIASGTHRGERCTKESFRAIRESEPEALVVAHLMNEDEVDKAVSHPGCIIASDGIYTDGQGHPRGAGTFPRFIREYVINKKALSLE